MNVIIMVVIFFLIMVIILRLLLCLDMLMIIDYYSLDCVIHPIKGIKFLFSCKNPLFSINGS